MFKEEINGTSLKNNLIRDHFFEYCQTLNIIDDYNIVDIKDDAISFYYESFKDTGVREVNIYFQVKNVIPQRREEINDLVNKINNFQYKNNKKLINVNKLLAFCVLLKKGMYPSSLSVEELVFNKANKRKVDRALKFIKTMDDIRIRVTLHPYNSLNFHPPFHGRYWFTDNKGYIVDASLQTYSTGMIFAQLMDEVNFRIIKERLFDKDILRNSNDFEPLTYHDLLVFSDFFGKMLN